MNRTEACRILDSHQLLSAENEGRAWGAMEVECWTDQHDGDFSSAPDWVMGNWCGQNPLGDPADDEAADAYDLMVDLAAEKVWNEARETAQGDTCDESDSAIYVICDMTSRNGAGRYYISDERPTTSFHVVQSIHDTPEEALGAVPIDEDWLDCLCARIASGEQDVDLVAFADTLALDEGWDLGDVLNKFLSRQITRSEIEHAIHAPLI